MSVGYRETRVMQADTGMLCVCYIGDQSHAGRYRDTVSVEVTVRPSRQGGLDQLILGHVCFITILSKC